MPKSAYIRNTEFNTIVQRSYRECDWTTYDPRYNSSWRFFEDGSVIKIDYTYLTATITFTNGDHFMFMEYR